MSRIDRRMFMGAAGVLATTPTFATAGRAANDRVRVGVVGLRSRGTEVAREFARNKGAEVVAVCDIDDANFGKAVEGVEKDGGKAPRTEKDFRRLLDDKEIDVIVNATPDHWHALIAVLACQAGKDVYTEKPASHNVVEGRRMVQAARKYNRVVQLGTQRRSMDHVKEAIALINAGTLGKVGMARAWIHQQRKPIGHGVVGPVPKGVDYAMWQGPALDRPFMANHFHYNWHWFWNWGTGELGNNGIHGLDVARWGLGVDAPKTVSSSGGKFVFDDDQEVPDTQIVTYEFPDSCLVWEHRMWSKHGIDGLTFGIAFYGNKGTLVIDEKGWRVEDPDGGKPEKPLSGKAANGVASHVQNFLDCVRSREKPNADIETGHLSTRLCHLGNIAYRTGRKLTFDASREAFVDAPEADKLLSREYSSRFEMPSQV